MSQRHEQCYAVLRLDVHRSGMEVTVKEIVWDIGRADEEVDRLNKLNDDKKCFYSCQVTRAEKREPGES